MKVMVLGASGYLGNTIYKKLKAYNSGDIYGTCYRNINPGLIKADLFESEDIKNLLSYKPDIIIWSVCDLEREMSLSQTALNEIINTVSEDVRIVYVSTTIGKGRDQAEDVIPHKRMPDEYLWKYINGKIEGESIVRKHKNHVIVRPGSIYGYDFDGNMDSRMGDLLRISKFKEVYSRTANMYASFVHVMDLADAIIELSCNDFNGTINISGEKSVSHYDFNLHLAELLNIDNRFIIPDYKPEEMYHTLNNSIRKSLLVTSIRDIYVSRVSRDGSQTQFTF